MKYRWIAMTLALTVAAVAGLAVAGDADYANCAVCKPMMASPELMQNLQWETSEIATGMVSITTVKPDYEEAYRKVHVEMMANLKKLESGEKMELCPLCQSLNKLAQAGAKIENIDGAGAHVMAVTSEDPAVIAKIHGHVKWAQEAFSKHQQKG